MNMPPLTDDVRAALDNIGNDYLLLASCSV